MTVRAKSLSSQQFLLLVILAAAVLRFAAALPGLRGDAGLFRRPDTPGYLDPARSLAAGKGYAGTGRAPGFPALAALLFRCGGGEKSVALLMLLLSVATVPVVYAAGKEYFGPRTGLIGAALIAFHPTAVANAPMLLSDTLFSLAAAGELYFFLRFWKRREWWGFSAVALLAAAGTLIRPINLPWMLPGVVLLAFTPGLAWRKKLLHGAAGCLVFALVLAPWLCRNAREGAGYVVDTNTGAMYHQNGAMILAAAHNGSFEEEKKKLIRECDEEFRDTRRYPDVKSREAYRIRRFREVIAAHPVIWIRQHFSWHILLPDLPGLLELWQITLPNRGTMDVLARRGLFAAADHYFQGHYLALFCLAPLLLVALTVCLCGFGMVCFYLCHFREHFRELLLFLAFTEYFFFLPGPITAPRYQLPALPFLVLLAAEAIQRLPLRHGKD